MTDSLMLPTVFFRSNNKFKVSNNNTNPILWPSFNTIYEKTFEKKAAGIELKKMHTKNVMNSDLSMVRP